MNSFNHYAYGAIGDWMYRVCAGIESGNPGYKHIVIQPSPTSRLNYAKATFESSYGTIISGWRIENGLTKIDIKIPANTRATVFLPADAISKATENGKPLEAVKEFSDIRISGNRIALETGSGEYHFEIRQ